MELPGFGMLQVLPPHCYPGAKPSQELQQLQNCAGLSWSLPGSQRGERGGNGRREWEQPNVERTMGYNQTLLAHHALPVPAFTWKG